MLPAVQTVTKADPVRGSDATIRTSPHRHPPVKEVDAASPLVHAVGAFTPNSISSRLPVRTGVFYAEPVETTPLTRDLLAWIAAAPRTYRETMEVWRTSCPRLSIWEDAVGDGLVRLRVGRWTELTPHGEAVLQGEAPARAY